MYLNFRMQELTIASKIEQKQNQDRFSKYQTRNTRYYKSHYEKMQRQAL